MLFPFTYPWIFRKKLGDVKTVLDLGCGDGKFMSKVNWDKRYEVTGVDLFTPYLNTAKKTRTYKKIIKKDIRKVSFPPKIFDAVIASQVIEHLEKKQGLKLIKKIEVIAKKKIIIGTPNGVYHQEEYDENKYQRHKSYWEAKDLQKLNYKIYGQGLKLIYGEGGYLSRPYAKSIFVRILLYTLSYVLFPIEYFYSKSGAQIIAVKFF